MRKPFYSRFCLDRTYYHFVLVEYACYAYLNQNKSKNSAIFETVFGLSEKTFGIFEPRCEKSGRWVSDQVSHKSGCTTTEDG